MSSRAAHPIASVTVREVKGNRTPGFVEVREGGVRERMAAYRSPTPAALDNRRITRTVGRGPHKATGLMRVTP